MFEGGGLSGTGRTGRSWFVLPCGVARERSREVSRRITEGVSRTRLRELLEGLSRRIPASRSCVMAARIATGERPTNCPPCRHRYHASIQASGPGEEAHRRRCWVETSSPYPPWFLTQHTSRLRGPTAHPIRPCGAFKPGCPPRPLILPHPITPRSGVTPGRTPARVAPDAGRCGM